MYLSIDSFLPSEAKRVNLPHGEIFKSLTALVPGGSCISSLSWGLIILICTCTSIKLKLIKPQKAEMQMNVRKICASILCWAYVFHPSQRFFVQESGFDKRHSHRKVLPLLQPIHSVKINTVRIKQVRSKLVKEQLVITHMPTNLKQRH